MVCVCEGERERERDQDRVRIEWVTGMIVASVWALPGPRVNSLASTKANSATLFLKSSALEAQRVDSPGGLWFVPSLQHQLLQP